MKESKVWVYRLGATFITLLLLLYLVDKFTIKTYGGGSGNLALLILPIYIPLLIWFCYHLYRNTRDFKFSLSIRNIVSLILISYISGGFFFQINKLDQLKITIKENMALRGLPLDIEYINQVTNGLTSYTNTIYFNLVTFFMCIAAILLVSINTKKKSV